MTGVPGPERAVLDMIVIGGGINGAGIAADASGRGLSVGLYESHDFGSATSSSSSKLIHGGLRYLEHYDFRLVAEALAEREVLLNKAPHIVQPMRFCLPHRPFLRPAWMIRTGLFLYDHLGLRVTLPGSKTVDLAATHLFNSDIHSGFEYSDCWVDDSRLVLFNALASQELGAEVQNYCKVENAVRVDGLWQVTLINQLNQQEFTRWSKALVNAGGPWVKRIFEQNIDLPSPRNIRLIKGSHIVIPKLYEGDLAYILQNQDGRIVFVIPYLNDFSMIGTTDEEYQGDPREVAISDQETAYLIDIVNQHFIKGFSEQDIIWSFSGVRPLCDDESDAPQAITRDYTLEFDHPDDQPPLLSVFGGKLTTYRKLAEAALNKLTDYFPHMGEAWTKGHNLPGGSFSCSREQYIQASLARYPWLDHSVIHRYVCQYGTDIHQLLSDRRCLEDMGTSFGPGLYQAELDYALEHEFVKTGEDFMWRRTKLGLYLTQEEQQALMAYIESKI